MAASDQHKPKLLGHLCDVPRAKISPLFKVAPLLVRLDHVARFIINANHGIM
jgi:hypothetical protein